MKNLQAYSVLIIMMFFLSSCANYNMLQSNRAPKADANDIPSSYSINGKKPLYASTSKKGGKKNYRSAAIKTKTPLYTLQPNDKISVSIWNHDDLSVGSVFGIYNSNEVFGKWIMINEEGTVNLPELGTQELAGLTITEAEKKLSTAYSSLIVEPVIVLKVLNREATVLGEVTNAGNFLLEKERNTFTEMIGKAGGFSDFADTKHIKLIRDDVEYLIDLTDPKSTNILSMNIESGDMIYVPSQRGKNIVQKSPALIAVSGIITTLVLLFTAGR